MTKQTLYSCKAEINGDGHTNYRISKFVDGDLESSYLTTLTECECPAGHRPSCRHRQMLPMMLAHGTVNTHWFWDFDLNRVVDFSGELKSNIDALNELAALPEGPPTNGASPTIDAADAAGTTLGTESPVAEGVESTLPTMRIERAAYEELIMTGTTMTDAQGRHIPQRNWRRL